MKLFDCSGSCEYAEDVDLSWARCADKCTYRERRKRAFVSGVKDVVCGIFCGVLMVMAVAALLAICP